MLYLLCAVGATVFTAFAQSWASCYAFILQQGATANSRSLWRAASEALRHPRYWASCSVWPYSGWHRVCAGIAVGTALLMATELLYGAWLQVMHGHISLMVGLWYCGLTVVLLFLAWCDIYTRLLPDALTIPLMILPWWVKASSHALLSTPDIAWWWGVAFYIVYRYGLPAIRKPWMGAGDIKLYLGLWAASPQPDAGMWLMVIAASSCWLAQAGWQRRCLPRGACAFGPYLCLAYSVINVWKSSLSMEFSPYGF